MKQQKKNNASTAGEQGRYSADNKHFKGTLLCDPKVDHYGDSTGATGNFFTGEKQMSDGRKNGMTIYAHETIAAIQSLFLCAASSVVNPR